MPDVYEEFEGEIKHCEIRILNVVHHQILLSDVCIIYLYVPPNVKGGGTAKLSPIFPILTPSQHSQFHAYQFLPMLVHSIGPFHKWASVDTLSLIMLSSQSHSPSFLSHVQTVSEYHISPTPYSTPFAIIPTQKHSNMSSLLPVSYFDIHMQLSSSDEQLECKL